MPGQAKLLSFEDFFKKTGRVYKDASVFSSSYIPNNFKYREKEWNLIGNSFSSFLQKINIHVYISGPPGTGKTHMVCKLVDGFNERLKNDGSPFNFVIVNCQKLTYPGVIGLLAQKYNPKIKVGKKNIQELVPHILEGMDNTNTCFIFDEADKMVPSYPYTNPYDGLFGDFSRFHERFGTSKYVVGCVVIANKPNLDRTCEPSIKDSFVPTRIYFKDYTAGEVCDILWERCTTGFQPGVINIGTVANFAKEVTNSAHGLRTVLKVFSNVGDYVTNHNRVNITNHNRVNITNADLSDVLKITEQQETNEIIRDLDEIMQVLLFVIVQVQKQAQIRRPNDRFAVTTDEIWFAYKKFEILVNTRKLDGVILEERTQRHIIEVVLKKLESYGLFTTGIKGLGRAKGQIKYCFIEPEDFDKIDVAISEIIKILWHIEKPQSLFIKNRKLNQ